MKTISAWFCIIVAVAVAVMANYLSTLWARGGSRTLLLALILISPIVFISFGLVTARLGLSVSSAVIDTLLTLSTIFVGLVIFHEWNTLVTMQYMGMFLALTGVFLMVFFSKGA